MGLLYPNSMEERIVRIYSSIRPEFKRQLLFHGSGWAIAGGALLLFGGIFIPTAVMSYIGLPLLFLGGGMIAHGLMPYRKLTQLETQPDEIVVTADRCLHYGKQGRPLLTVPASAIERVSYCDEEIGRYGIVIDLNELGRHQIVVHAKGFSIERFIAETHKRYDCDLFFPYFSQKGYREVASAL